MQAIADQERRTAREDHDRALGLPLLRREGAQGEVRPRRERGEALPAAREAARGDVLGGRPALRLRSSRRSPTCRSYHPDVRVWEVTRRAPGKHVGLWYFDPYARAGQALGRLDERLPQPGAVRRRDHDHRLEQLQLREGQAGRAGPDLAGTTPRRSSTSSATRCTACPRTSPTRRSPAPTWRATTSSSRRSSSSTGCRRRRCSNRFALHDQTGKPIPQELVREDRASAATFNQGFATVEYLASALVDMKLHLAGDATIDPDAFERETLAALGMPKEIVMRHRTPQFAHIFSGDGYSAGYYSYLWADTLTADAFEAFTEAGGPYDKAVAKRLVDHVFSVGNTVDPADGYRAFRGKDPGIGALMRQRGFPVPASAAAGQPLADRDSGDRAPRPGSSGAEQVWVSLGSGHRSRARRFIGSADVAVRKTRTAPGAWVTSARSPRTSHCRPSRGAVHRLDGGVRSGSPNIAAVLAPLALSAALSPAALAQAPATAPDPPPLRDPPRLGRDRDRRRPLGSGLEGRARSSRRSTRRSPATTYRRRSRRGPSSSTTRSTSTSASTPAIRSPGRSARPTSIGTRSSERTTTSRFSWTRATIAAPRSSSGSTRGAARPTRAGTTRPAPRTSRPTSSTTPPPGSPRPAGRAEFRIPFSSLRYPKADPHTWGILVWRNYPRDFRYAFHSSPIPRGSNCLICHMRSVTGLSGLPEGGHLVVAPYATARAGGDAGAPGPGSPLENGRLEADGGVDVKWTPSRTRALDATINPDFSQVEADVAQIAVNERFALFFPEKRPFFLEGVDLLETPIQAVYTRTITSPRWGLRAHRQDRGVGVHAARRRRTAAAAASSCRGRRLRLRAAGLRVDGGRRPGAARLRRLLRGLLCTDREIDGRRPQPRRRTRLPVAAERSDPVTGQFLWSETEDAGPARSLAAWDGAELVGLRRDALLVGATSTSYDLVRARARLRRRLPRRRRLRPAGRLPRAATAAAACASIPKGLLPLRARLRLRRPVRRDRRRPARATATPRSVRRSAAGNLNLVGRGVRPGDPGRRRAARPAARSSSSVQIDPGRRWPRIGVDGTFGEQIDFANAREGTGASIGSSPAPARPTISSCASTRTARWVDVEGGRLFTAEVERLQGDLHLQPPRLVRLIGQYVETENDPELYTLPGARARGGFAGSALFAYKLNWQTVLFARLRRRADSCSTTRSLDARLERGLLQDLLRPPALIGRRLPGAARRSARFSVHAALLRLSHGDRARPRALRPARGGARPAAQAVLAEIAETAAETLELQDVFGRVATSIRRLIPFDNMGVVRVLESGAAVMHATTVPCSDGESDCTEPLTLEAWSPRFRPVFGPIARFDDGLHELDAAFPGRLRDPGQGGALGALGAVPPGRELRRCLDLRLPHARLHRTSTRSCCAPIAAPSPVGGRALADLGRGETPPRADRATGEPARHARGVARRARGVHASLGRGATDRAARPARAERARPRGPRAPAGRAGRQGRDRSARGTGAAHRGGGEQPGRSVRAGA